MLSMSSNLKLLQKWSMLPNLMSNLSRRSSRRKMVILNPSSKSTLTKASKVRIKITMLKLSLMSKMRSHLLKKTKKFKSHPSQSRVSTSFATKKPSFGFGVLVLYRIVFEIVIGKRDLIPF